MPLFEIALGLLALAALLGVACSVAETGDERPIAGGFAAQGDQGGGEPAGRAPHAVSRRGRVLAPLPPPPPAAGGPSRWHGGCTRGRLAGESTEVSPCVRVFSLWRRRWRWPCYPLA